jgi:hypothetical protein
MVSLSLLISTYRDSALAFPVWAMAFVRKVSGAEGHDVRLRPHMAALWVVALNKAVFAFVCMIDLRLCKQCRMQNALTFWTLADMWP